MHQRLFRLCFGLALVSLAVARPGHAESDQCEIFLESEMSQRVASVAGMIEGIKYAAVAALRAERALKADPELHDVATETVLAAVADAMGKDADLLKNRVLEAVERLTVACRHRDGSKASGALVVVLTKVLDEMRPPAPLK